MEVNIQISWNDAAKFWVATNDANWPAIEDASLSSLKARISALASEKIGNSAENLEVAVNEGKHPSGYQFDSEIDRLRWEDNKKFMDDGWEGPKGDFSKTDLKWQE